MLPLFSCKRLLENRLCNLAVKEIEGVEERFPIPVISIG
jgi:hypothetical protein